MPNKLQKKNLRKERLNRQELEKLLPPAQGEAQPAQPISSRLSSSSGSQAGSCVPGMPEATPWQLPSHAPASTSTRRRLEHAPRLTFPLPNLCSSSPAKNSGAPKP